MASYLGCMPALEDINSFWEHKSLKEVTSVMIVFQGATQSNNGIRHQFESVLLKLPEQSMTIWVQRCNAAATEKEQTAIMWEAVAHPVPQTAIELSDLACT